MKETSPGYVDSTEMKLRNDADFIASLDMIGEGAPVFEASEHRKRNDERFGEEDLPSAYQ